MIIHCIPFSFSQCFRHLDLCLIVENCVLIGLDWVELMMQLFLALHMFMYSFHAYIPFLFYLSFLGCDCVLFSLSLLDRLHRHPSTNLLRLGTLFILSHLLPPILLFPLFTFSFVMRRPIRTSWRTFLNVVFIRSAM